jgi:hypothetical protein
MVDLGSLNIKIDAKIHFSSISAAKESTIYYLHYIVYSSFLSRPMAGLKLVLAEGKPRFACYTFLLHLKKKCDKQPF